MLLHTVAKEGFTKKVAFEVGVGVSGEDVGKKSDPGRRVDRFKSLEAEACLACVKSSDESGTAGIGGEVQEATWGRPPHEQQRESPELRSGEL